MRMLVLITVLMLGSLQYTYWFGDSGYFVIRELTKVVREQHAYNEKLRDRNAALRNQIRALRTGDAVMETIARTELGMIAPDETFFLVVRGRRED